MSPNSFISIPTQDFLVSFPSRKLLLFHNPLKRDPGAVTAVSPVSDHTSSSLTGNALMVLSVLVCGIICSLGLHYIIRCTFRCSTRFMISEPVANTRSSSGSANKGIKQKVLKNFPVVRYSPGMDCPGLGDECVICLSDFGPGDNLRLLPKCNHGFHVHCIDKWLKSHSSCPKCRHCPVETSRKVLKCNQMDLSAPAAIQTESENIAISVVPLEPERRINSTCEVARISSQ